MKPQAHSSGSSALTQCMRSSGVPRTLSIDACTCAIRGSVGMRLRLRRRHRLHQLPAQKGPSLPVTGQHVVEQRRSRSARAL